jgi:hypothetical protein
LDAVTRIGSGTGRRTNCSARRSPDNRTARIANRSAEPGADRRAEQCAGDLIVVGAINLAGDALMGILLASSIVLREFSLGFALRWHYRNRRAHRFLGAARQKNRGGHREETHKEGTPPTPV